MGRTPKDYTDREKQQDRKFTCIWYPDSKDYDVEILKNRLSSWWDHAVWILHDHDKYTQLEVEKWQAENDSDECPFKEGDLKKPHYHVIAWQDKSPVMLGTAAYTKFGVDSHIVQRVKSLKGAIRYLVHLDNPDKYQYNVSEIHRENLEEKELMRFLKLEVDAVEKGKMLFEKIQSEKITLTELTKFALENNCYDELRRGQHLFTALLQERW